MLKQKCSYDEFPKKYMFEVVPFLFGEAKWWKHYWSHKQLCPIHVAVLGARKFNYKRKHEIEEVNNLEQQGSEGKHKSCVPAKEKKCKQRRRQSMQSYVVDLELFLKNLFDLRLTYMQTLK